MEGERAAGRPGRRTGADNSQHYIRCLTAALPEHRPGHMAGHVTLQSAPLIGAVREKQRICNDSSATDTDRENFH